MSNIIAKFGDKIILVVLGFNSQLYAISVTMCSSSSIDVFKLYLVPFVYRFQSFLKNSTIFKLKISIIIKNISIIMNW